MSCSDDSQAIPGDADLGAGADLGDFAMAVVQHLSGPAGGRSREVVEAQLERIVQALETGSARPVWLLEDPELLASLFQNADLLDPSRPRHAALLGYVMSALEQGWYAPDPDRA